MAAPDIFQTQVSDTIQKQVPDIFQKKIPEASYVNQTIAMLSPLGFTASNTIPCVSLCRDELTIPMLNQINKVWGPETEDCEAFIMHSLGGMLLLGKTGMNAAMSHAPIGKDGKMRYVFYCFPHIGRNEKGVYGLARRHGMNHESHACGALISFRNGLLAGNVDVAIDPDDVEQSLLKQRLIRNMKFHQEVPSLEELTMIAHTATLHDLQRLIQITIGREDQKDKCDYAVFTGVQINHGVHVNSVWPSTSYAVVGGEKIGFKPDQWSEEWSEN